MPVPSTERARNLPERSAGHGAIGGHYFLSAPGRRTGPRPGAAYHGGISVAADNPVTCGARAAQGISGAGAAGGRRTLKNPYMERIW